MRIFQSADILLPKGIDFQKWAVIACDQFTSQPEYWQKVRETVGDAPSALNLILPEVYLDRAREYLPNIHRKMREYLQEGLFRRYSDVFVYVERTLMNGQIRKGIVGAVDLECYDYAPGSRSVVRASEKTVVRRLPPRMAIRRGAPLELPHVLLLCDDETRQLIEPFSALKARLPKLYDFDLMLGGGHVAGYLVSGDVSVAFQKSVQEYCARKTEFYRERGQDPVLFAVGDGNHSLAAAKACYEEAKTSSRSESSPRYALVELESVHDRAIEFLPIHRLVTGVNPTGLLEALNRSCGVQDGIPVRWISGKKEGTVLMNPEQGTLAVGILQRFLDEYQANYGGEIDYIHGDQALADLAGKNDSVGFLLPPVDKADFFRSMAADGILPQKTFSMGNAEEKRYYIEAGLISQKNESVLR